jgi:two-component system cell cycle response regulator DivK
MSGKLILIVDDDAKSMKLTSDLVQMSGYSVISAGNGQQAVEIARASKPCLILMDIQLPVMDGLEATRILKSDPSTRHIKIVALTASAMRGDEDIVLQAGCDGYISKPIEIHSFLDEIQKYLQNCEGN